MINYSSHPSSACFQTRTIALAKSIVLRPRHIGCPHPIPATSETRRLPQGPSSATVEVPWEHVEPDAFHAAHRAGLSVCAVPCSVADTSVRYRGVHQPTQVSLARTSRWTTRPSRLLKGDIAEGIGTCTLWLRSFHCRQSCVPLGDRGPLDRPLTVTARVVQ